jgi:ABC-2 type transport system permease protein
MKLAALRALVRKDLRLYFTDRRAVVMGFVAPIAIASFFGSIFSGGPGNQEQAKVPVAVVDQDNSDISRAIVRGLAAEAVLSVTPRLIDQARDEVIRGNVAAAVVIPPQFGKSAGRALFIDQTRPELTLWNDPSRSIESSMVEGLLAKHVMQVVMSDLFGGASGKQVVDEALGSLDATTLEPERKAALSGLLDAVRNWYQSPENQTSRGERQQGSGFSTPYAVNSEALIRHTGRSYNGYAHSFAGMGVQFLLFAMIDLGVGILLERERGLWKRLRSAPLSRTTLLLAKAISGTLIAMLLLAVCFAFAMLVFQVRIYGSLLGFALIGISCCLMASSFGLMLATFGKTPGATRGVAILAVLLMVMLGGAWVPSFVFPAWLQQVTVLIPTRWAVDGLDAMTWRGLELSSAITPSLVLFGFSLLFAFLTVWRFRWEE